MEESPVQTFLEQVASMPDEDRQIFESLIRHIQRLLVADRKLLLDEIELLERRVGELESQDDRGE